MLETVSAAIDEGELQRAGNISGNLTRMAHQLESSSDMFMGDMLNAVCGHLEHVRTAYVVPRDDFDTVFKAVISAMQELVANRKEGKETLSILEQLRCISISFVLTAEQRYPVREPSVRQGR